MPESGDKIPPEIPKEEVTKYFSKVRLFSFILLYASLGMAIGTAGGLAIAILTNTYNELPPAAATTGAGIGALAGAIRSRFR